MKHEATDQTRPCPPPRSRASRRRRGAAAVEFALCAPILFMIVFAIVEFCRMLEVQHGVREAALEGARAGITLVGSNASSVQTASVTTAATSITSALGIVSPTITVSPNPITETSSTVTVTVSANPAQNGWFMRFFTSNMPISSTITLTREVDGVSVPPQ